MSKKNVLSLFDGCSCAQQALIKSGIPFGKYYASEIDPHAIKVTMKNFPNTIQVGDVRNINSSNIDKIWLLTGGSPCTDLSIMGTMKGLYFRTLDDYLEIKNNPRIVLDGESYLFWEYVRLNKELSPEMFFLENVRMKKEQEKIITNALEVEPIAINSSLLSAQNRERLYWTNIPNASVPKDKGILFSDIVPNAKSAGKRGVGTKGNYVYVMTVRKDGKSNCLVTSPHQTGRYVINDEGYHMITPEQAEMLQTMPVGFTECNGVSKTNRYRMIGNAWTIDVIVHIFSGLK